MEGHVFILRGDLTKLYCDAWLMPTDRNLRVMKHWLKGIPGLKEDWKPGPLTSEWQNIALRVMKVNDWPAGEPTPWFVNTGAAGGGKTADWYAEGVGEFFEKVAPLVHEGKRFTENREKPLVGLPIVGTGAGGAYNIAGDVVNSLLPVLYRAASKWKVDIALCVKEGPDYAAAINARRTFEERHPHTRVWPEELSKKLKDKAQELADRAKKGELVLFLGAGVSAGAGLPNWEKLLEKFSELADFFDSSGNLDDLSRKGFKRLNYLDQARLVADYFYEKGLPVGKEVSKIINERRHYSVGHASLAALPVIEVVTTNYDSLFETASEYAQDGRPRILPYDPATPGNRWILKLHGCVSHPEDIVLTRSDYLRYDDRRAALKGIVQALLITRHMLFVGFSLTDDNFQRIIEEVRKAVRGDGRCLACGSLQDQVIDGIRETKSQERFGTVLSSAPNHFVQKLWDRDLYWFNFCEKENPKAYRLQEIFLDYLASLSASATAHLMNPIYDGILSAGERKLRDELERMVNNVNQDKEIRETAAWRDVENLLKRFGKRA